MATLATDDFNRTDAATLGANWSGNGVGGWDRFSVASNTATCGSLSHDTRTAETFPDDQWAQATISNIDGSLLWGGVMVRSSSSAATGYVAGLNNGDFAGGNRQRIWKVVAGTRTSLAISGTTDIANGDVIYLEIQGDDLIMKVNGVQVLSVTDADIASGKPGLTGRNGTTGTPKFDDFTAGDFAAGGGGSGEQSSRVGSSRLVSSRLGGVRLAA